MDQARRWPVGGKAVLVTGGAAGLDKATALGLVAMGAHRSWRSSDANPHCPLGGGISFCVVDEQGKGRS